MSENSAAYDIAQILNALPHRYPLLLVDKVKSLKVDEEIHAIKAVSFNEQFFQGHFPGRPIMPGVLQIEALAQAHTRQQFSRAPTRLRPRNSCDPHRHLDVLCRVELR